jgi:hypothetical protein
LRLTPAARETVKQLIETNVNGELK